MNRDTRSCFTSLLLAVAVLLIAGGLFLFGLSLSRSGGAQSRTNVLILGLDRRPDQGYVVRSDTVMLLTACPANSSVGLLSIPRDLYVEIPGRGEHRINAAHFFGEMEGETGGPALAMATVEQNFNVPVHHYVRLDFDGFRAIVDALGGIDIVVEEAIVDEAYPTEDYGTIRIEIPAGPQHLDGETALRYARSRHGSSDFDRAERQQKVLRALVHRLLLPKVWPRLPAAWRTVMDNVDTDLTARGLVSLGLTLFRAGPDGIEHRVIDREMTRSWRTSSGGAVLLPRWELIHPMVAEMFAQ